MLKANEAPLDPLSAGFHLLAQRPYSVADLRRKLEKKFGRTEAVAGAIARLRELGYLDDRRVAAQVASSLAQDRGYGAWRIRQMLKAKLIDYKYIEPALVETFRETSEREILERVLDKKLRRLRLPLPRNKLRSLHESLLRRGFRPDVIMEAVRSRPELKRVAEDAWTEALSEETE